MATDAPLAVVRRLGSAVPCIRARSRAWSMCSWPGRVWPRRTRTSAWRRIPPAVSHTRTSDRAGSRGRSRANSRGDKHPRRWGKRTRRPGRPCARRPAPRCTSCRRSPLHPRPSAGRRRTRRSLHHPHHPSRRRPCRYRQRLHHHRLLHRLGPHCPRQHRRHPSRCHLRRRPSHSPRSRRRPFHSPRSPPPPVPLPAIPPPPVPAAPAPLVPPPLAPPRPALTGSWRIGRAVKLLSDDVRVVATNGGGNRRGHDGDDVSLERRDTNAHA